MTPMTAPLCLTLAVLLCVASAAPEARPAGTRVKLSIGELFIPQGFGPSAAGIDVVLQLHGSAPIAEAALMRTHPRGVLVTVALPGLSGVYAELFTDPGVLDGVLAEVSAHVAQDQPPVIRRLTVASFSAGFGGVRELLKCERHFRRIDALVMADSIYCGYVGPVEERRVDPSLMEGFLRFAREAAQGRKVMVISHSDLIPGAYASTRETADYLISRVGGERSATDELWAEGFRCTSRYERGSLRIYGFAGDDGPAHMQHLHNLWRLMERAW